MAVWNRDTAGLCAPDAGYPILERHFAWLVLQDPAVPSVDIRDCAPSAGHVTMIVNGGDPVAIMAAIQPLTDVVLHVARL